MLTIAVWLAVAALTLAGTAWGTPKALHAINDRRHAACLVRIATLETELGLTTASRHGGYASFLPARNTTQPVSPKRSLPPAACGDIEAQIEANRKEALRVALYTEGKEKAASEGHEVFRRPWTPRRPPGR